MVLLDPSREPGTWKEASPDPNPDFQLEAHVLCFISPSVVGFLNAGCWALATRVHQPQAAWLRWKWLHTSGFLMKLLFPFPIRECPCGGKRVCVHLWISGDNWHLHHIFLVLFPFLTLTSMCMFMCKFACVQSIQHLCNYTLKGSQSNCTPTNRLSLKGKESMVEKRNCFNTLLSRSLENTFIYLWRLCKSLS